MALHHPCCKYKYCLTQRHTVLIFKKTFTKNMYVLTSTILKKYYFCLSAASFSMIQIFFWLSTTTINNYMRWFYHIIVEFIDPNHTLIDRTGIKVPIYRLKYKNRKYNSGQHIGNKYWVFGGTDQNKTCFPVFFEDRKAPTIL